MQKLYATILALLPLFLCLAKGTTGVVNAVDFHWRGGPMNRHARRAAAAMQRRALKRRLA